MFLLRMLLEVKDPITFNQGRSRNFTTLIKILIKLRIADISWCHHLFICYLTKRNFLNSKQEPISKLTQYTMSIVRLPLALWEGNYSIASHQFDSHFNWRLHGKARERCPCKWLIDFDPIRPKGTPDCTKNRHQSRPHPMQGLSVTFPLIQI